MKAWRFSSIICPPILHLVIATRSDPPIPLARLRARGQMTEIRADDLRFSYEETVCFFNQIMGLGLTPEDMTRLEERTEGWIAGLQMAALALKSISQTKQSDTSLFVKNFCREQPLYSGLSGGGSPQSPTPGNPGFSAPDFDTGESQWIPLRRCEQDPFLEIGRRGPLQPTASWNIWISPTYSWFPWIPTVFGTATTISLQTSCAPGWNSELPRWCPNCTCGHPNGTSKTSDCPKRSTMRWTPGITNGPAG